MGCVNEQGDIVRAELEKVRREGGERGESTCVYVRCIYIYIYVYIYIYIYIHRHMSLSLSLIHIYIERERYT